MKISSRVVWTNDLSLSSDSLSSDLERIPSDLLASLNLLVADSKFQRLDYYSKNLPKPGLEYNQAKFEDYDYHTDYDYMESLGNESRKREAGDAQPDYDSTIDVFVNGTIKEVDYDLEEFQKEYDSATLPEPDIQSPPPVGDMGSPPPDHDEPFEASETKARTNSCLRMSSWRYIFFGASCFWYAVTHLGEAGAGNAAAILLRTLLSWSALFAVIASLLWCYKGACCCCLPFAILHPYEATKDLKAKVLSNPPGVERLADGSVNTYQPSRAETRLYNKLMDQVYS